MEGRGVGVAVELLSFELLSFELLSFELLTVLPTIPTIVEAIHEALV